MTKLLYAFLLLLPVCAWPIFLRIPKEISPVFGTVEADFFVWYRMWLVSIVGFIFLVVYLQEITWTALIYWILLLLSTAKSFYLRTAIFGAPWTHEGLLAITGYIGIFLAGKKHGFNKEIGAALGLTVTLTFLLALVQLVFLKKMPLYAMLGNQNHLGLFAALFFPAAAKNKRYWLAAMALFLLIVSQSRSAWVAVTLSSFFFLEEKRIKLIVMGLALLAIPFYKSAKGLSGREEMWKSAIPQMKETIFLGNGPGNFAMYYPQGSQTFGSAVVDRPHNLYINIWTSTGLISLSILLLAFIKIIYTAPASGLTAGAVSYLICSLATDTILPVTPYFLLFLGMLTKEAK